MSLVVVIVVKIKQKKLPHQQKELPERIIYLPIALAIPLAILSAILPKTSAITQPQTLKGLLTNYVKLLLKRLSFNTSIWNNTSGLKLTYLGMLLVECWVRWLMTWAKGIW